MPKKIVSKDGYNPYFYEAKKLSLLGTRTKQKTVGIKPHAIVDNFIHNYDEKTEPELGITKPDKVRRLFYLGIWTENPELIFSIAKYFPRQWLHISRLSKLENLIGDIFIEKFKLYEYERLKSMTPEELEAYDKEQTKLRRKAS